MRLKQIRDGLEDLEYMYLLEEQQGGNRSQVLPLVQQVVTTAYDFDHSVATMQQARQAIGKAIVGS